MVSIKWRSSNKTQSHKRVLIWWQIKGFDRYEHSEKKKKRKKSWRERLNVYRMRNSKENKSRSSIRINFRTNWTEKHFPFHFFFFYYSFGYILIPNNTVVHPHIFSNQVDFCYNSLLMRIVVGVSVAAHDLRIGINVLCLLTISICCILILNGAKKWVQYQ